MSKLTPCVITENCVSTPGTFGVLIQASHPECGSVPRWYVLQTEPRCERFVLRELAEIGFNAYMPQVLHLCREVPARAQSRHQRTKPIYTTRPVPMFPGYVFVSFDRDTSNWRDLCRTMGVKKLFCHGPDKPTPIRLGVIEAFRAGEDERLMLRSSAPLIEAGAIVKIEDGPFADHNGVCLWNDQTRIRLLVSLFGRETEMTLNRTQVKAV